ncbi:FtsJ methyltransferase domain-containing protein 2 [Rhizopus stolonifer]|uniref:Cap-specific mRNA (nucleoside-2'-O-)-methyltransferase 1 n=1 Tax=Rhizopus stolonifer TaxID=4846 RepID=A0A367K5Y6_RHIST|nr:FtsJ methyltransferase domain-containing protein 2 [Rhizopus stolonifer]
MEDLYSDNDPSYRETRVPSGIPPPTLNDVKRKRPENLSSYNPALLRQRNPPVQSPVPVQRTVKPLDLTPRISFLKCPKRLSVEALVSLIRPREASIDYDLFCSKSSVEKLFYLKEKMRRAPRELVAQARSKSNPFERIGNAIFMNRAAVKLAAIDADFGVTAVKGNKPLTFLDICGGPGGFSEYLIWRIYSWGESCFGYGITLKSDRDEMNWHTEKFREDIPQKLTLIHGEDGTGNLYRLENIKQVESVVAQGTDEGVDLAVADGASGFDFSGQEAQQEQLAQKLLLCEIITMLSTLRAGGTFVCKFFDMLTPFTVNLVWLLYQLFDEIAITKPFSSRPANSERYVVCRGLVAAHPTSLIDILSKIAVSMDGEQTQFIPQVILEDDEAFIDYMRMRNLRLISQQIEALEEFDMFVQNP